MRNYGSLLHAEEFNVTFFSRLIAAIIINLRAINSRFHSRIPVSIYKKRSNYIIPSLQKRIAIFKNIAAMRDIIQEFIEDKKRIPTIFKGLKKNSFIFDNFQYVSSTLNFNTGGYEKNT